MLNGIIKEGLEIELIHASSVCPNMNGFQSKEESSYLPKNTDVNGYCSVWSMFFTELSLRNPKKTSAELIAHILKKTDKKTNGGREYLRRVARGYVNIIYRKIEKYFSFITGKTMTVDQIVEMEDKQELLDKMELFVDIEMFLLNSDESLTNEAYIQYIDERIQKEKGNLQEQKELFLHYLHSNKTSDSAHTKSSEQNRTQSFIDYLSNTFPTFMKSVYNAASKQKGKISGGFKKTLKKKCNRTKKTCKKGITFKHPKQLKKVVNYQFQQYPTKN